MRILDLNRPTIGAISVGLAQGAIDQAVAYGRERKQFGQPITEFQGIQFMLADMQMQTEAARCLLYDCSPHGRPPGVGRLLGQGLDGEMLSPATSP